MNTTEQNELLGLYTHREVIFVGKGDRRTKEYKAHERLVEAGFSTKTVANGKDYFKITEAGREEALKLLGVPEVTQPQEETYAEYIERRDGKPEYEVD